MKGNSAMQTKHIPETLLPLATWVRLAVMGILALCITVSFAYASMHQRKYDRAETQPTKSFSTWLRPDRSLDGNRRESVPLWTRRGIGSDS